MHAQEWHAPLSLPKPGMCAIVLYGSPVNKIMTLPVDACAYARIIHAIEPVNIRVFGDLRIIINTYQFR